MHIFLNSNVVISNLVGQIGNADSFSVLHCIVMSFLFIISHVCLTQNTQIYFIYLIHQVPSFNCLCSEHHHIGWNSRDDVATCVYSCNYWSLLQLSGNKNGLILSDNLCFYFEHNPDDFLSIVLLKKFIK